MSSCCTSSCPATERTGCSAPAARAAHSPASPTRTCAGRSSRARRARRPRAGHGRGNARQAVRSRRRDRALEAPPEPPGTVAFIAPFDSLLWDTKLLADLFGFDFVWEGFFKSEKRRWGYYVLPVVFGDRFVGRIEPRIDRDQRSVEVLGRGGRTDLRPARRRLRRRMQGRASRVRALRRLRPARVAVAPRCRKAIIREVTSQSDKVEAFRSPARIQGLLRHPEPVGRRQRAPARAAGLPRAGDDERRFAWTLGARQHVGLDEVLAHLNRLRRGRGPGQRGLRGRLRHRAGRGRRT